MREDTHARTPTASKLLTATGSFAGGHRLSRRGVRYVVDGYLRLADVKRPRVSNNALRHISATLAYRYTHDSRAVQDMLGHRSLSMVGRCIRDGELFRDDNPATGAGL